MNTSLYANCPEAEDPLTKIVAPGIELLVGTTIFKSLTEKSVLATKLPESSFVKIPIVATGQFELLD